MTITMPGRHRRPGRLSAASTTLTRSAAVAAASTGLLAGTTVSANASHVTEDNPVNAAEALLRLSETIQTDRTLLVDRPAKAVPAPESSPASFGTTGFSAFTPVEEVAEPETEAVVEPDAVAEPAVVAEPEAAAAEPAAAQAAAATQAQTQASAAVETRSQAAASRTEVRTAPPAAQVQPAAPQAPARQAATQSAIPAAAAQTAAPAYGGAVGIASGLMGIPYAYGSSNPGVGFDCSGFTRYVYAQLGISLPHSAAAQQASTTPVSNPQPGDLVFFGYPAWHVGIYAGNGMIYHATNPGSVSNMMSISSIYGSVSGYGRP